MACVGVFANDGGDIFISQNLRAARQINFLADDNFFRILRVLVYTFNFGRGVDWLLKTF